MNKSFKNLLVFVLSIVLICPCSFANALALAIGSALSEQSDTKNDYTKIEDYIIVEMENEFSFPREQYSVEYFGIDYFSDVVAITDWNVNCPFEKDKYNLVLKLYLTKEGKSKTDEIIDELSSRRDIRVAEYDYSCKNVLADIELPNNPDWIPYEDYIIVEMENEFSFPEKDYDAEYFGSNFVSRAEPITSWQKDSLTEHDKYNLVLKVFLTELGKTRIDYVIDKLSAREDIRIAERDYLCKNVLSAIAPNDTYYSNQYAPSLVMAQKAWAISTGSTSIRVGVLDTGINSHPDLSSNLNTSLSRSFVAGETFYDGNGHGTSVAGILAARGNNNIGICGMAWYVNLISLKVTDEFGSTSNSNLISAINYASNNAISILNISLNNMPYSSSLENALRNYNGNTVVSAGNNHGSSLTYPAAYNTNNMIIVAASTASDTIASFSDYNQTIVDIAAPGDYVYSTTSNSSYAYTSGTSLSAPLVAGTIALMRSVNLSLTPNQIKSYILNSVDYISNLNGFVSAGGRLNAFRAVRWAWNKELGDADLNGTVDTADARQVLRWAIGLDSYSNLNEAMCDLNYSGTIDVDDSRTVLRIATGEQSYVR